MPGLALPLTLPLDNYRPRKMTISDDLDFGGTCLTIQMLSPAEEQAVSALIGDTPDTPEPAAHEMSSFNQASRLADAILDLNGGDRAKSMTTASIALVMVARAAGLTDGAELTRCIHLVADDFNATCDMLTETHPGRPA